MYLIDEKADRHQK